MGPCMHNSLVLDTDPSRWRRCSWGHIRGVCPPRALLSGRLTADHRCSWPFHGPYLPDEFRMVKVASQSSFCIVAGALCGRKISCPVVGLSVGQIERCSLSTFWSAMNSHRRRRFLVAFVARRFVAASLHALTDRDQEQRTHRR
jgi:hypothetical protein